MGEVPRKSDGRRVFNTESSGRRSSGILTGENDSALGMRPPTEYRATLELTTSLSRESGSRPFEGTLLF
jgi:hypothetical protein